VPTGNFHTKIKQIGDRQSYESEDWLSQCYNHKELSENYEVILTCSDCESDGEKHKERGKGRIATTNSTVITDFIYLVVAMKSWQV
jgi:hypothetical protein